MTDVTNTKRKFGAARDYVFIRINGQPALLTPAQAEVAIDRAVNQPEDVPSFLARVWTWLGQ